MTNNKDHTEDIIRKLIQSSDLESPSDNFIDNIMNKIKPESQIEEVKAVPDSDFWQWFIIGVPALLLVAGAIYYYWLNFLAMFDSVNFSNTFVPFIQDLFGKASSFMAQQEYSPVFIIIVVSVGSLVILDQFLRIGKRMRSYLLVV